jgi:uncharacterized protein YbjQ (UPF0145 family)
MGFFVRGDGEDAERSEDLARIEAGGIPTAAQERLQGLASDGSLFTSGLSVNEFALLSRLRARPLAQVMGASVVRPGWQYLPALDPGRIVRNPWYGPTVTGRTLQQRFTEASPSQVRNYTWHQRVVCLLDELTDAWNLARRRALDRLAEEALQVGADAVVGVQLRRSDRDLGKGLIDYVVTGTAIRHSGSTGESWPVLTDVSLQDYWRLLRAGHEPVGLVATSVVVFASPALDTRLRRVRTLSRNQELDELSRGFHAARDTVRARLIGQVYDAHGTGAVGVEFSHSVNREKLALASVFGSQGGRGWFRGRLGLPYYVRGSTDTERKGWVITMHAAGTAIRPRTEPLDFPVKTQIRMGAR